MRATQVTPRPAATGYATASSQAWTGDLAWLLTFFAPDGTSTDVAMGATDAGRDGISSCHRFMLTVAPDSLIEIGPSRGVDGLVTSHDDYWDLATVLDQASVRIG